MGRYILLVVIRLWSAGEDTRRKFTRLTNPPLWRNQREWHEDHLRHQLAHARASTCSEVFLGSMNDDVRVQAVSPLRLQTVLLRYLSVVEYPRLAFWPGHNHPNYSLAPVKVTAYRSSGDSFST